ncbi:hypothetical protein Tco_0811061 [Tanacetum coccineum]
MANDLCSLMIQTTLSVDFEEDINTKSHELMSFVKSNVIKEDEVKKIRRPIGMDKVKVSMKKGGLRSSGSSSMNDEALAREVECRERELANQEYRQCQKDIRFYLQPYDHLSGDALRHMEEVRPEIKVK